ncbi:hypothetical protein UFOVP1479_24 [uncultured Caudovirales phage]|jgi:hypothetical protein|uniref:DUF5681 domain-containing protein n=1 Tax=uncultured Caudovirales phage TaxID=2100421 RepID=A0A6J5SM35_9CAUD|nr:hypothetical protein UFOVP310_26 [uncultured Caudovirales phage]CAB4152236.1 hypothetical protein UFOVP619_4 [uncultured Caudovirales phage]CAB4173053.1 hypothetical protein UFOVP947_27 [uncultured Caudovirales phage]CAB4184620.1 hypothetical protein UFOVP1114_23 [uncultured Caudovirales phage]CAB4204129.1 hypothetical protein UFOVP1386_23 [uncultured Caudovirales phage]
MSELIPGRNGGSIRRWSKGESGNPKGRPKKLVPSMKVEGYKLTEINDTIQALVSMNVKDLKSVYENPNATILEKTVAAALRKSLEEGDLDSIETLMNRVYGKPKEKMELLSQSIIKVTFGDEPKL